MPRIDQILASTPNVGAPRAPRIAPGEASAGMIGEGVRRAGADATEGLTRLYNAEVQRQQTQDALTAQTIGTQFATAAEQYEWGLKRAPEERVSTELPDETATYAAAPSMAIPRSQSFAARYATGLADLANAHLKLAPNDQVRALVQRDIERQTRERLVKSYDYVAALEKQEVEARLNDLANETERQAGYVRIDDPRFGRMLGNVLANVEVARSRGQLDPVKAEKMSRELVDRAAYASGVGAASQHPEEFLELDEQGKNPYRGAMDGDRYTRLVEHARKAHDSIVQRKLRAADQVEREIQKAQQEGQQYWTAEWARRLAAGESPDAIEHELNTRGPDGTRTFVGTSYEHVLKMIHQAREQGGPGDPQAKGQMLLQIETGALRTPLQIQAHPALNLKEKQELLTTYYQKKKQADISDNAVYRSGAETVERRLGGTSNLITRALGLQVTVNAKAEAIRDQARVEYRNAVLAAFPDERALLGAGDAEQRVQKIADSIVMRYQTLYPDLLTPAPAPQQPGAPPAASTPSAPPAKQPATKAFNPRQ